MLMICSYTWQFDHLTFKAVSECVKDITRWFLENELLLNPAKMEAVLFGTKAQHEKIPVASGIDVAGTVVLFHDTVKLLSVTLNSALMLETGNWHVTQVQCCCIYHTSALHTSILC